MPDIVLHIVSDINPVTVDHVLSGEVVDYRIVDNSNYQLDTAFFRIKDDTRKYEGDITASDGSTLQVWRAFSRSGQLINSGVITKVTRDRNYLIVEGVGMTKLMMDYVVEDVTFTGSNLFDMLADSTAGLIQGSTNGLVPAADYGAFNFAAYVSPDTGSNYNTLTDGDVRLDGDYLFNIARDLSRKSYGANSKQYDFYLFEENMVALEDDSGVNNKTTSATDTSEDFSNVPIGAYIYNAGDVAVGGLDKSFGYVTGISTTTNPNDTINFTGGLTGGAKNHVDDSDALRVQIYNPSSIQFNVYLYLKERELSPIRKTITQADIVAPRLDLSVGEDARLFYNTVRVRGRDTNTNPVPISRDWWTEQATEAAYEVFWGGTTPSLNFDIKRNTTVEAVGSSCAEMEWTNAGAETGQMILDLQVAGAYDSTQTPSAFFTQGSGANDGGYILDFSKDQYIDFRFRTNAGASSSIDVDLHFSVDGGGLTEWDRRISFKDDEWSRTRLRLNDIFDGDLTGGLITSVTFVSNTAINQNESFYVDGLHFSEDTQVSGSDTDGTPTFDREYVYYDSSLDTNDGCTDVATAILNAFKRVNYSGNIELNGVKRDFNLRAGDNLEVIIPSKGINIQSGETHDRVNIQAITYTPNKQNIQVGRSQTAGERSNDVTRLARNSYVRTGRI